VTKALSLQGKRGTATVLGYLNFEFDRPTIVWSVADRPHPLLAWGEEIHPDFDGGRAAAQVGPG
jgi:hypothetical protein